MRLPFMLLATSLALLPACRRSAPGPAAPPGPPPPTQVGVLTIALQTVPIQYDFVGQTEASRSVEIRARVAGFLLKRFFEEGKPVKEGELLFQIDPATYQADLQIAQARLAQANASSELADADLARLQQAAASGAANRHDIDQAQTEAANAHASVNLAKAELDKAQLNLSYCQVRSPVNGIIGRSLKDEGSYVDAGDHSLLAVTVQTDPIYLTFPISERDYLTWRSEVDSGAITGPKSNPPVKLILLDGSAYPSLGAMTFLDPNVNPSTGSFTARATFPNPMLPDTGEGVLKPGEFVKALLVGWSRPNSIVVPQRAVMLNPTGASVMVVGQGNQAEVRPVKLGDWKGEGWLILQGLKPGERIVAEGVGKVQPGSTVAPVPFTPQPLEPAGAGKPPGGAPGPTGSAAPASGSGGSPKP